MRTIENRIESRIGDLTYSANKAQEKLNENFVYNFKWGYAEELYRAKVELKLMQNTLLVLRETPESFAEMVQKESNLIVRLLLQPETDNRKGDSHGTSKTLEVEVNKRIHIFYSELLQRINSGDTLI